jgi:hypothetical protein
MCVCVHALVVIHVASMLDSALWLHTTGVFVYQTLARVHVPVKVCVHVHVKVCGCACACENLCVHVPLKEGVCICH